MDLKDVFVPYDSPIDVIFNRTVDNIMVAFNNSIDDGVVTAVVKAGFNVDKDKLVEVFTQDKRRYEEAYRKGYAQRDADIIRCKDCKHRPIKTGEDDDDVEFPKGSKCVCQNPDDDYYSWYPADNWFCGNGEPKDGDGDG